jgi:hypothetical protein
MMHMSNSSTLYVSLGQKLASETYFNTNCWCVCLKVAALSLCLYSSNPTAGQEKLLLPSDKYIKASVVRASDWLASNVRRGVMRVDSKDTQVSVIAWKDLTLNTDDKNRLAGYAITDTLWSSYALTVTKPELARELHDSLDRLDCLSNSLHEVIWEQMDTIHHKPLDTDMVHGRSLGVIFDNEWIVDVRSFKMAEDATYSVGHPLNFAEHAVYQSLFEYRNGEINQATQRLRKIFQANWADDGSRIRWDSANGVLIDFVNEEEYSKFLAKKTEFCRQYTFKLASLLYACRLMGLDREFSSQMRLLEEQILTAQLPSGGVSHYMDVSSGRGLVTPGPDATGEATAIFILTQTIQSKYRR